VDLFVLSFIDILFALLEKLSLLLYPYYIPVHQEERLYDKLGNGIQHAFD
jgi:hypothetical protein